ncbi:MAG: anaerobic glycerol-3-phosphate dehydrogenase subunit C [Anaerolineales bacterium]|nr:anaerobic glycerol-3-phosphate dehydrogenase subunit C [Anaerolineales bacterium]
MRDVRLTLDHCVKCNICTTACPVAAVTPLFPGPKYVGPQAERFRLELEPMLAPEGGAPPSPDHSIDYCSGCGICSQVCPQGVKIAEINTRARAAYVGGQLPLRNQLIARPDLLGTLGTPFAPIANATLASPPLRGVIEGVLGIHAEAPLPPFAGRTFQQWARRHRRVRAAVRSVAYFHGCSTNYYEPGLGALTVQVLEHNGCRVIVPRDQTCCGLPLQSNGDFQAARAAAQRLVSTLLPYAEAGYDIVATSTSCGLMLKREYMEILGLAGPEFKTVSARMWDICEYLWHLHEQGELDTDFQPVPLTVPYHAPCQQKGHGIGKPALDLFGLIPQLRVVEMTAACCGIAGTYGLKKEKYQIAMDVGAPLFADIRAAQPDVAACDSETCRWQITHGSGVRAVHPVAVLAQAYGIADL